MLGPGCVSSTHEIWVLTWSQATNFFDFPFSHAPCEMGLITSAGDVWAFGAPPAPPRKRHLRRRPGHGQEEGSFQLFLSTPSPHHAPCSVGVVVEGESGSGGAALCDPLVTSQLNSYLHPHLTVQGYVSSVTVAVLHFWWDTCEPLGTAWSSGAGEGHGLSWACGASWLG